jgi:hypothetical protein
MSAIDPVRLALAKLATSVRALGRAVTPPGNRASLDSSYRQPNADGTHVSPASAAHQQQQASNSG